MITIHRKPTVEKPLYKFVNRFQAISKVVSAPKGP